MNHSPANRGRSIFPSVSWDSIRPSGPRPRRACLSVPQVAVEVVLLAGDGEIVGRLTGEARRAAPAARPVRSGTDQSPRDLDVAIDDREHERAESVFGRAVQVSALFDQSLDDAYLAVHRGQHDRRLAESIESVDVDPACPKLTKCRKIARENGHSPIVPHLRDSSPRRRSRPARTNP